jgi:chemotaxis protein MotB
MMTLLFGFFVILTAFSTPDPSKVEKLKETTAKSMGGQYQKPFESLNLSLQQILQEMKLDQMVKVIDTGDGIAISSKGTLFFDSGSSQLKTEAETLLLGVAEILAKEANDFRILVEGHTDDVPTHSKLYPSNWELSSARASTVVRLLESKGIPHANLRPLGFADTEPSVPNLNEDGTPNIDNRAINRRIVVRIQRSLPKRMKDSKI